MMTWTMGWLACTSATPDPLPAGPTGETADDTGPAPQPTPPAPTGPTGDTGVAPELLRSLVCVDALLPDPMDVNGTVPVPDTTFCKATQTDDEDRFGSSVAISSDGSVVAIGAFWEDGGSTSILASDDGTLTDNSELSAGAVYIVSRDAEGNQRDAYVKALNGEELDQFGWAVALSEDGRTLAVGAPYEDSDEGAPLDDNSRIAAGAVYVFVRGDDEMWTHQAMLKAPVLSGDPSLCGTFLTAPFLPQCIDRDHFGYSVALSADGNTLAVGAPHANAEASDDRATRAGAVHVFSRTSTTWTHDFATTGFAYLGHDVDLSGDGTTLVAGSRGAEEVRIYTNDGGWSQTATLTASNGEAAAPTDAPTDWFGLSVAISGDGTTVVVGAPNEDSSALTDDNLGFANGAAYVFDRQTPTTWSEVAYLKAPESTLRDKFGETVDVDRTGEVVVVGAPYEDGTGQGRAALPNNDGPDAGAVFLFRRNQDFQLPDYLKSFNSESGDHVGWSLALAADGDQLIVGAPRESSSRDGLELCDPIPSLDNSAPRSGAAFILGNL